MARAGLPILAIRAQGRLERKARAGLPVLAIRAQGLQGRKARAGLIILTLKAPGLQGRKARDGLPIPAIRAQGRLERTDWTKNIIMTNRRDTLPYRTEGKAARLGSRLKTGMSVQGLATMSGARAMPWMERYRLRGPQSRSLWEAIS
jgi:hypothetical protein